MNIICSESTIINLAFKSLISLTSPYFEKSLATLILSFVIGAPILILTPLFFAFSRLGSRISSFLFKPSAVVIRVIVFSASLTNMSKWL